MKTKRLYREDVYLRSCTAQITGVRSNSDGRPLITLNQTIFFPTGGGQSCDLGTIAGLAVADVFEADGEICHVLAEDAKEQCKLSIGDEIEIAINWERRFDNMQRRRTYSIRKVLRAFRWNQSWFPHGRGIYDHRHFSGRRPCI